ncbi:hypothetical protein GIB67_001081 [Kingdonia uniflora]|uniref:Uncharacterized protein n=1 Tax=Kingdonia uniflora TaxID=39325 RepID=A0A7J7MGK1_9MAGN|nr:hypothetical protein GIB67_001081 [Kingdonia uniflora]
MNPKTLAKIYHPVRALSLGELPSSVDKLGDDKSSQCSVTCAYLVNLVGMCRNVTVLWCKNFVNLSLHITVDIPGDENTHIYKIEIKPWQFWSKKGLKSFEVEGKRVDVFWDLRAAKFPTNSPEPSGDYYVALVYAEEVMLLLGDLKKKAYKKTKSRPSLVDAILVYKKEHVFAKKSFTTRGKFDQMKKEHEIVVENSFAGPRDPEMWISVDGIVLVHITNLQWKFRGNQTILINKMPVQVYWDVHDWMFGTPGAGHGLFIFKPGAPDLTRYEKEKDGTSGGESTDSGSTSTAMTTNTTTDEGSRFIQGQSYSEFSLFLYAWKIE